jgi:hypothetical protein
MRPVRFHARIEADLDDAIAWYDGQQRGLGDRFISEFRAVARKVAEVGHVVRQADGVHRHLMLANFPYSVYFRDDGEGFMVLLVINAAREPALIQGIPGEHRLTS